MSKITIQCKLIAPESTRHQLWKLMAEKNTPLIDKLLKQLAGHPDLETWKQKGKLPLGTVKNLCQPLRKDSKFIGQPGRFYSSAISLVEYIYKSWLKLQQRLIFQLKGQERWLTMLKSDEELITECDCSLEQIQNEATRIINNLGSDRERNTSSQLFKLYDSTQDIFTQCAIAYLLKNGCKIPQKPENAKKFTKRRRKAEIKINRLNEKLNGKAPQGRDLTGQKWLDTLLIATTKVPKDETEAKFWQNVLLTKAKSVPYPIAYESNEDLTWIKNEKGRLCVKFNGLGESTFEIYCNRRQLTIFQRFYEDQQIKKASKNNHSSALFTLRSARIAWQKDKDKDKDKPWNINRLILFCTFDTLLLTQEGTELVRQEKAEAIALTLTKMNEKGDLNQKHQRNYSNRSSS